MIKHQEELIDVTGTQCPLHGIKYNKVLSENNISINAQENIKRQSSDYDNNTSIKKDYSPY